MLKTQHLAISHAGVPGFSGGFVGVDVFFVISGFLITSIILKEIKEDKFSVARFYERRIRRIFPALFPLITFTLVVGAFLFDPVSFRDFGNTITATTLFASNILFWHREGYFDLTSLQRPLLHTWSLAVEEQFYIIFPLLLIAINRFSKKRYFLWLIGIGLASLFVSIYSLSLSSNTTFYLVHTRAWELIFGSILALAVIPQLQSNVQRNIVSIIGLSLIVFSIGFYCEATLFPGTAALAPVGGAFLIIYSGIGVGGKSVICRFLSLKPIVYIGLISYSLYLWHWPLIVFTKYMIFRDLTPIEITGIILTTFAVSALSMKFIEQPFRGINPVIPERYKLFALSAVVMLIASIIGSLIHWQKGVPGRFPEASAAIKLAIGDSGGKESQPREVKNKENISVTHLGADQITPSFIIWGDSHANALTPVVDQKGKAYGLSGYSKILTGTSPLLGLENNNSVDKARLNREVLDFIQVHPEIKTVIIAGFWLHEQELVDVAGEYSGRQPNSLLLRVGLLRTVNSLLKMGRRVVVVSDVPILKGDPVHFLFLAYRFHKTLNFTEISTTINEYQKKNETIQMIFKEISEYPNVTVIHPESMLLDKTGQTIIMINNRLLYEDYNHLTKFGAEFVSPLFDQVFQKMANEK